MSDKERFLLSLAAVLVFGTVTFGIGLFHTEETISGQRDCPACQFQSSSLSVSPTALISLPPLVCRGLIPSVEPLRVGEVVLLSGSSRAPPLI